MDEFTVFSPRILRDCKLWIGVLFLKDESFSSKTASVSVQIQFYV